MKKISSSRDSSSSRSGLLLMEIIIAILFFSLASAICLQLFVKAHNLGRETRELDMAVRQASSAADILSQSETPMETLQKLYPDSDLGEERISVYFDQDFLPCDSEQSCYLLNITPTSADGQSSTYGITVQNSENSTEIYSLEVVTYQPYLPGQQPVGTP